MNRNFSMGFYLGILSVIASVGTIVGCIILGDMVPTIVLSIIGIVLFVLAVATKYTLIRFLYYFCYLAAGATFISGQLYTITNVMAGIDAQSFEMGFMVTAAGVVLSILLGMISMVPKMFKE